jgi:hypothetical protein
VTAIDSITSGTGNGTSASWSHTCAAGATGMTIGVAVASSNNNCHSTSVKYNNVALSSVTSTSAVVSGNTMCGELWSLPSPTVGANTVSVTVNNAAKIAAMAVSVLGGSITSVVGSVVTLTGNSASPSLSAVASGSVNDLLLSFGCFRGADTIKVNSVGPNETSQGTIGVGTGGGSSEIALDTKAGNGSTTSMTFNLNTTSNGFVMLGVAAIDGGGGPPAGPTIGSYYYLRRRRML